MRLRDLIHLRQDEGGGRVPLADAPDPHGGSDPDPAPGTGLAPEVTPPDTAAEPLTPDTGGGPPQAIPYSRFQEVNERRKAVEEAYRPFAEIAAQGYEPDDLHRLVQWETEFTQDPATSWLATAESIMDRLPEPVQEAIRAVKGTTPSAPEGAPAGGTPPATPEGEEIPTWFKPYAEDLEARQKREREYAEAQASANASATAKGLVDKMVGAWKTADERDGIVTADATMLTYIISASQYEDDPVKVLQSAREQRLADREADLKGVVRPGGNGGPRSVPSGGSGSIPRSDVPRVKSLGQASKLAMQAIAKGELPAEEV